MSETSSKISGYLRNNRSNESSLYTRQVEKYGKPSSLQEKIIQVGYQNCEPFMNTSCRSNNCVYDISELEELYQQKYGNRDTVSSKDLLDCRICNFTIKFSEFYSSEQLVDDIEDLFLNILGDGQYGDLPSGSLRVLDQEEPINQKETSLFEKIPIREISQILNQSDEMVATLKMKISLIKTPSIDEFTPQKIEKIIDLISKTSENQLKIKIKEKFCFGDELDSPLTTTELKNFIQNSKSSLNIHKILLNYWRVRLCKDKGLLMSAWMYEMDKHISGYSSDNQDRMIMKNNDYPFIIFIIIQDSKPFIFEYDKQTNALKLINIISNREPDMHKRTDIKSAFELFDRFNETIMDGEVSYSHKSKELYQVSCKDSSLIYIPYIIDKFFTSHSIPFDKNLDDIGKWIIYTFIRDDDISHGIMTKKNSKEINGFSEKIIDIENGIIVGKICQNEGDHESKTPVGLSRLGISPINKLQKLEGDVQTRKRNLVIADSSMELSEFEKIFGEAEEGFDMKGKAGNTIAKKKESPKIDESPGEKESPNKKSPFRIMRKLQEKPKESKVGFLFSEPVKQPTPVQDGKKSEDIKQLLNFYYIHDKERFRHLSSKFEETQGKVNVFAVKEEYKNSPDSRKSPILVKDKLSSPSDLNIMNARPSTKADSLSKSQNLPLISNKFTPKGESSKISIEFESHLTQKMRTSEISPLMQLNPKKPKRRESIMKEQGIEKLNENCRVSFGSKVPPQIFESAMRSMERRLLGEREAGKSDTNTGWHLFGLSFFANLIEDIRDESYTIRYNRIEHMTDTHRMALYGTIFTAYDLVVIPMHEEIDGVDYYRVIIVENKSRRIVLLDPATKHKQGSKHMNRSSSNADTAVSNKFTNAIFDYVRKETKHRTGVPVDAHDYSMHVESLYDEYQGVKEMSSVLCLHYIEQYMKGKSFPISPGKGSNHLEKYFDKVFSQFINREERDRI